MSFSFHFAWSNMSKFACVTWRDKKSQGVWILFQGTGEKKLRVERMMQAVNGRKVEDLKEAKKKRECWPLRAAASRGCFVVRAKRCVSWGTQKKYTNPTEGAFLARLWPHTHGSLFKPPPIPYSSVRGGLLTQPNSTQQNLDLDPTEGGGRAHTLAVMAAISL